MKADPLFAEFQALCEKIRERERKLLSEFLNGGAGATRKTASFAEEKATRRTRADMAAITTEVLSYMKSHPASKISDIANATKLKHKEAWRVVKRLEKQRLVSKKKLDKDEVYTAKG